MSGRSAKKGRKIDGETTLRRIRRATRIGDAGTMHIDRIYAQGGKVCVQLLKYAANEIEIKMMDPIDAARRMKEIQRSMPEASIPRDLPEAVVKAVIAALRQQEGGDKLLVQKMDEAFVEMEDDLMRVIQKERTRDPELDAEMRAAEMAAGII
jgi:hypothetical protein